MKYLFEQYGNFLLSATGHTVLNRHHIISIVLTEHQYFENEKRRIDIDKVVDKCGNEHTVESRRVEQGQQAKYHLRENLGQLCSTDD